MVERMIRVRPLKTRRRLRSKAGQGTMPIHIPSEHRSVYHASFASGCRSFHFFLERPSIALSHAERNPRPAGLHVLDKSKKVITFQVAKDEIIQYGSASLFRLHNICLQAVDITCANFWFDLIAGQRSGISRRG